MCVYTHTHAHTHTHRAEHHSVLKKKEILSVATMQMDPEGTKWNKSDGEKQILGHLGYSLQNCLQ